jgi:hypothetical protein
MLHLEHFADKDQRVRSAAQTKKQEEELMKYMVGLERVKDERAAVMQVYACVRAHACMHACSMLCVCVCLYICMCVCVLYIYKVCGGTRRMKPL